VFPAFEKNRSMIFNPLIIVASELGISNPSVEKKSSIVNAFRQVNDSGIGSVIVDSISDDQASEVKAHGAYTVQTDMSEFGKDHNYRSNSGAERIAATVNRFDRYYTHDIVVAVPDDMPELKPYHMQALMYALSSSEVGVATMVAPLSEGDKNDFDVIKATVDWNSDRIVYPLEGSKVGTLIDVRRDIKKLDGDDIYKLVPIHAWRRGPLDRLVALPPSDREFDEGTDLVRAIDAGMRIDVTFVTDNMKVLITPEELIGDEIEG
jgi:3-deoxy-manno-octulosonate cytidylyltransferase (CMP-KDO synthetase)|tara:strand:+ start:625 stop:1416 length:792 start_codon:yes stop_codon:yes gene_type:complete